MITAKPSCCAVARGILDALVGIFDLQPPVPPFKGGLGAVRYRQCVQVRVGTRTLRVGYIVGGVSCLLICDFSSEHEVQDGADGGNQLQYIVAVGIESQVAVGKAED